MAQASDIREHMEIRDSAGLRVGTVDYVAGDRIVLTRSGSADGHHHDVPLSAVARVDAHVHLSATAAALGLAAAGASAAPAGDAHPLPPVLNRAVDGARPRGNFYLPWIVGLIGLVLLFFLFKSCVNHQEAKTVAPDNGVVAQTPGAALSGELAGTSALGRYLGGPEATPRTFTFEKLNFDTGKGVVRDADRAEVDQVADVLKQYGTARIRIAGYADARGADEANMALGKARADAVKAALVAQGIDASRIETVSGGENDPIDSNATAPGQAENRRTELAVTAR